MAERILFFFSALGVFNAFLLSIYYLFVKQKRQISDYLLGGLLLCLVIRVAVSCFHFFGTVPNDLIKLGLVANLFLGPLVFLLLKAMIGPQKQIIDSALWHFGIWFFGLAFMWFVFDFPTWDWKVRFVIHFFLTFYFIAVAFIWRKEIKQFFTKKNLPSSVRQSIIIYLSLLLTCLGFAVSLFTSYILGPLFFSIVFYAVIAYFLLDHRTEKKKTLQKKIDEGEFNKLNQKLTQLMEIERLYKNPDLNLELLASKLSIGRHLLSQLLNENLQKNFHQYINDYRIREACQILKENKHFSIEAIGYEVGFHSRSSFFAAFKKQLGITPSKYREKG